MRTESNNPVFDGALFDNAARPAACGSGFIAPEFCLPATDCNFHTLSELRGPNGLVVILLGDDCPYSAAILPRIVRDVAELHRYGIGAVAVHPGRPALHPAGLLAAMAGFALEHQLPCRYLLDAEQKLARALGATHTPDFFGFDRRLELRYHGRLDASRREAAPADARRELFAAMRQIALFGSAPRQQLAGVGNPIPWVAQPAFCKDSTAPN
jgi:peroxiredoxin